jgi:uncharacterized protein YdcH (DUF465 family)
MDQTFAERIVTLMKEIDALDDMIAGAEENKRKTVKDLSSSISKLYKKRADLDKERKTALKSGAVQPELPLN